MPNNGMENAAFEETLYITFEHLKLHNVKEKKGVLIIFFPNLPKFYIAF